MASGGWFPVSLDSSDRLAPADGLGPFDTPEQALAAVRKWVWDWAVRYYG